MGKVTGLAARILQRRKQLHLTQKQVAERMGVSLCYFSHLERGRRTPWSGMLTQLADGLNCSSDWLLGRSPHPKQGAVSTVVDRVIERVVEVERPPDVEEKKITSPLERKPIIVDRNPFQEDQMQSDGT